MKAAQPDATIERMETDADGATYEAHITKADGTRATVLLDANFTVTETQEGPGRTRRRPWRPAADDRHGWLHVQRLTPAGLGRAPAGIAQGPSHALSARRHGRPGRSPNELPAAIPCFRVCG